MRYVVDQKNIWQEDTGGISITDRSKFKKALNELDSSQRTALLYLEDLILSNVKNFIPQIPKTNIDLSPLNNKTQSNATKIDQVKNELKLIRTYIDNQLTKEELIYQLEENTQKLLTVENRIKMAGCFAALVLEEYAEELSNKLRTNAFPNSSGLNVNLTLEGISDDPFGETAVYGMGDRTLDLQTYLKRLENVKKKYEESGSSIFTHEERSE